MAMAPLALKPDAQWTKAEWLALAERMADLEAKAGTPLANAPQFQEDILHSMMPTKEDLPLLVAGLGAGSSEAVGGFLQSKVSQLATYKAEYVEILAGWAGYKYFQKRGGSDMNKYLSAFSGGVVIGAVGSLAKANGYTLGRFLGGATAPASSSSGAPTAMSISRVPI